MSDEPTPGQATAPTTTATGEIPPNAWGQPISAERQAELQGYLDRWQAETAQGDRKGPFDHGPGRLGVWLTGADVSWLAKRSGIDGYGKVPNLHLEGAIINEAAHQEVPTIIGGAHLEGANLSEAHLERVYLYDAHLEGASLDRAHLEGAKLYGVHLEGATIGGAHLEGASLDRAHLEGADFAVVHMRGRQDEAHVDASGAIVITAAAAPEFTLSEAAHLEGTILSGAQLEGANLRGAWLDSKTVLWDATLDSRTRLGDIQWSGVGAVNLTRLNWDAVRTLGDEQHVGLRSPAADHEAAVRAYRQVSAQLRAQGLSEVADRFGERAQVRLRKQRFRQILEDWKRPWRIPFDLGRWVFSWFLAVLAGYGYHPERSLAAYLLVITGFALAYFRVTHGLSLGLLPPSQLGKTFDLVQAFVLSFSAFHGRGFFNPPGDLGDSVAILATAEAVCGLFIEISFIATFTQRFFGAK